MATTSPVIKREEKEGKILYITFIDGLDYKLQHPGNRTKLQWEKEYFNLATGIDQEKFLDKCFAHVVFPDGHDRRPDIDTVRPKELEVWARTLKRFLDGDMELIVPQSQGETAVAPPSSGRGSKANP